MVRERLSYLPIAVFLCVCASHAQNPPLPPPPASEPSNVDVLYRVTPAGTLVALDRVRLKKGGRPAAYYFEGEASSVVFKPGEAQVMAIRLVVPFLAGGIHLKEHPPEEQDWYATRLKVENGKRLVTDVNLPLEERSYGTPTPHPIRKWTDLQEQSFQLIPRQTLPPGEYVFHYMLKSAPRDTKSMRYYWDLNVGDAFATFGVAGP